METRTENILQAHNASASMETNIATDEEPLGIPASCLMRLYAPSRYVKAV